MLGPLRQERPSVLRVAVAADKNRTSATIPAVCRMRPGDRINAIDLRAYGVASSIVAVHSGSD